jgi:hypothetical protein
MLNSTSVEKMNYRKNKGDICECGSRIAVPHSLPYGMENESPPNLPGFDRRM